MNNYRPVSLLNAFSKVFEKIVFFQLYDYFKDNKLLYNGQYGFRRDHSTELATMELIDRALSEIDRKNCAIAVFMDLSKAFDTLDHKILIKKIHYYGVRDKELEWFTNYLNNGWQYVELDNVQSQLLELQTGVPQGSILGPLLLVCDLNRTSNCYGKTWRFLCPFFRNLHLRENLARDCFTSTVSTVTNAVQISLPIYVIVTNKLLQPLTTTWFD